MGEFLPTIAVLLIVWALALRFMRNYSAEERPLLWASLAAHQFSSVAYILVCKYYYGYGDMLSYHSYGVVIADRMRSDFLEVTPAIIGLIFHTNRPVPVPIFIMNGSSGTMQGIAGIGAYCLFDSLYAVCALIAAAAFFSKVAFYRLAREELPHLSPRALLWSCTLVPSAVFWSSSLLKEPIAMIGFLFALRGVQHIVHRRQLVKAAVTLCAGMTLVVLTKGYIAPVLAVGSAAWYYVQRLRERKADIVFQFGRVVFAIGAAAVLISLTGLLLPLFAVDSVQEVLATQQAASASVDANSNYSLGAGTGSASAQLAMAPLALFTALFRPLLFEARNPLMLANALENAAYLLAVIWIPFRRGLPGTVAALFRWPFLSFCLLFVVAFGTFTALGSTNLGALSRYRTPLVPFLATLLVALLSKKAAVRERAAVQATVPLTAKSVPAAGLLSRKPIT